MVKAIRRGYTDASFGQIHWRSLDSNHDSAAPDIWCLHPAPYSGLAYTQIMPHLADCARIFAPDYPGYGGSDPVEAPTIEIYAKAIAEIIEDAPVDLVGFHTGCLVAAEMVLAFPQKIRRIVMIDVPYLTGEAQANMLAQFLEPFPLSTDMNSLAKPWELSITKRKDSQPLSRCFSMLAEQLRAGAQMNSAFHSAFSYDARARLPSISHPALILATQSGLLEPTRSAAAIMPSSQLVERLDVKRAVLDESAQNISAEIIRFLEG